MATSAKSIERLARLRQPGFPGRGGKRIVSEHALQGILPMITQAILDQADRDRSPRFTSIEEPSLDRIVEAAMREMLQSEERRN